MTAAWWGKEASIVQRRTAEAVDAAPASWPELVDPTRDAVFAALVARIPSYTAEWTNRRAGDAGIALAHLFSEQMEPVLQRLNQLPQNAYIQFLKSSGIQPLPPTPAEALLQFSVSSSSAQPISIPAGFQVGASASSGMVIFETNADLVAMPGTIQEIYAYGNGLYRVIDPTQTNTPFLPFGNNPTAGFALFIGLPAPAGIIPGAQVSFGIQVQGAAGQPPPVATGGVAPLPTPLAPLLQWDVLDSTTYREARVVLDETNGLVQSGIVTLGLPQTWGPGIPSGAPDTVPLLWVRLQILYGSYPEPPVLLALQSNMVRAVAVQTFYNEVLTAVPGPTNALAVMVLSQTPVLPGSLVLEVIDTADLAFSADPHSVTPPGSIWTEVDDLSQFGPTDQVYELDSASGQVTFGDGTHGMRLPPGFRNVIALQYQVGGGLAGAVGAGQISNVINSVPFLSSVTNPMPASGGMDAETQAEALQRGPEELRARGRAVAAADYEVLALRSEGAQVARAYAVPGLHPAFPGTPIPGVVGVFVIPIETGAGAPIPTDDALLAVSTYLSSTLAPLGVEVVTAAPIYHTVRIDASVVIDPTVGRSEAVESVTDALNTYLDPVVGGDDGQGWPFGGTLSNVAFVRLLLAVPGVTAVPSLTFTVDGIRGALCADAAIPSNSLVWPGQHEVLALGPGEEP
jgi:predicted phage baseplate assembly protein